MILGTATTALTRESDEMASMSCSLALFTGSVYLRALGWPHENRDVECQFDSDEKISSD